MTRHFAIGDHFNCTCCFENEYKKSCVLSRNFISSYKIKRTLHGGLGIRILSSSAESISHESRVSEANEWEILSARALFKRQRPAKNVAILVQSNPALWMPAKYGHLIIMDNLLCPWGKKALEKTFYYINTIKYQVSFRAKTWYLHTWKYHHCYGYIINRAFRRKKLFQRNGLVFHWCLYNKLIEHYMAAWR